METIREANCDDARSLLRLLRQVNSIHARIHPDIFKQGGTKYAISDIKAMIKDDKTRLFVCETKDSGILGYAFCLIEDVKETTSLLAQRVVYIDDLCVDETYRGHGIGTKLYEHVKAFAKNIGAKSVRLSVWNGNDDAERFYLRLGMRPLKTVMEQSV